MRPGVRFRQKYASPQPAARPLATIRRTAFHACSSRTAPQPTIGILVEEGKQAPDFELASDSGERVRLSNLRGRPVVLYFYPKDDTPGCTAQACSFRDAYGEFETHGATIVGVSPDTEASHVKFKEKYGLPFTLLADPEHEVAELYGVWVEKNMYGKTSMGIKRSTFVIDADGSVAKAMLGVSPEDHVDVILSTLP
jgi:thioredoxin-dependent peroxiredoxin